MARILNFSLTMKNGYKVERDIAELREHFDLETVLGLYKEGKLRRWLKQNKYAEEAAQLDDLDEDAPDFTRAFCRILGVEAADHDAVDVEEISERTWRLRRLRDYTTDPYLLDLAENAAFSQSDLDELIDNGADEIVLCDGRFTIPLKARGTKYYGVGKAIAVIESDEIVDFERKYITFQKVQFDERYQSLCERSGTVVPRKRAEEAATEARQREEEERRALEQRTVDQESQALRMKLKAEKAPAILAETIGVLMHGSLFGGAKIWYWSHTADVSGFSFRPCGRNWMKNFLEKRGGTMPDEDKFGKNEKILGGVVLALSKKKDEGFTKGQWGSLAMMAAPLIPGIGWTVAAALSGAMGGAMDITRPDVPMELPVEIEGAEDNMRGTAIDIGLKTVAVGVLKVAAQKGKLPGILKMTPLPALIAIGCSGMENFRIAGQLANHQISTAQAVERMGRVNCAMIGKLASHVITGKVLTMIPGVGAVAGSALSMVVSEPMRLKMEQKISAMAWEGFDKIRPVATKTVETIMEQSRSMIETVKNFAKNMVTV